MKKYINDNRVDAVKDLMISGASFSQNVDFLSYPIKTDKEQIVKILLLFGKINISANGGLAQELCSLPQYSKYQAYLQRSSRGPWITLNLKSPWGEVENRTLKVYSKTTFSQLFNSLDNFEYKLEVFRGNSHQLIDLHKYQPENQIVALLDEFKLDLFESEISIDVIVQIQFGNYLFPRDPVPFSIIYDSKYEFTCEQYKKLINKSDDWVRQVLLNNRDIPSELIPLMSPSSIEKVLKDVFAKDEIDSQNQAIQTIINTVPNLKVEVFALAAVSHNKANNLLYLLTTHSFEMCDLLSTAVEFLAYKCVSVMLNKGNLKKGDVVHALTRAKLIDDLVLISMLEDKLELIESCYSMARKESVKSELFSSESGSVVDLESSSRVMIKHALSQISNIVDNVQDQKSLEKISNHIFDLLDKIKSERPNKLDMNKLFEK